MTGYLLLLVKGSVIGMVLAIGMQARWADVLYLWRRPGLMIRSFLAMYVFVPLVAFVLVKLLPAMNPAAKAALLVLAVSAGAPLLPRKLAKFGEDAYTLSLVVISSLLATILVPAWVALLAAHFGASSEITVLAVIKIVGMSFLLPIMLGMALKGGMPWVSKFLAQRLLAVAGAVLLLSIATLLVLHWQVLLLLSGAGVLALFAMLILAIAIGHWLGGPVADHRRVLAIACATRHLGLAIVVAAKLPGVTTVVLLITYVLSSAIVSAFYLVWLNTRAKPHSI